MIIMLTDNLMMKNSVKMIEDYSKINSFKDKLEDYTMMEDRDIEQVKLWGKYLAKFWNSSQNKQKNKRFVIR